jgi:hypothetical protein
MGRKIGIRGQSSQTFRDDFQQRQVDQVCGAAWLGCYICVMGGPMSRILIDDLAKEWMKDPAFRREYDALEEEFALASDRSTRSQSAPKDVTSRRGK